MVACAAGCQSARTYRAAHLPPQYAAPEPRSAQRLDLSRLASSAARSDSVQTGDVLEISVATGLAEEKPLGHPVRVADNGVAEIPLVGPVQLAGLSMTDAEQVIFRESVQRGIYRTPSVAVSLKKRRAHTVTVMGEVVEPGLKELPAGNSDLLTALAAGGGLTKEAGTVLEIRYPAMYADQQWLPPRFLQVDLAQATAQGGDFRLPDGTTVMVPKRPREMVHVLGLVHKPGGFELPIDQELRLLDALALAGGRTLELADEVTIIRQLPTEREPVIIEASVREAKRQGQANIRLAAGDVVSVEETPLTFALDTVRNFIRFGFTSAIPGL
jgi:polysaccharide biosynthesis/export protein